MRAVLVLPPFDVHSSYGGGGVLRRGILPALGVGYLAAAVEARGHEAAFVDAPLLGLDIAGTADAVLAERPGVVGISCLTKLAASGYALAAELKRRAPEIPIVMGGPHVSAFPDGILQEQPGVDILVPGEGELTFGELLDCMERGQSWAGLEGIVYRDADGQVVATPPRTPVKNLDELPHPARHIYRSELYIPLPNQSRRRPATTVITSRGCPWGRCRFCYQGGRYAAPYRRRSPENVVDEIKRLVAEQGIREIIFWDDNFGINKRWVMAFCDLLDKERLDITWTAQARVDTVSEEMLKRMAASGCYNIYYGLESGSQKMLDVVNKGITLEQVRAAVKWAKAAGMEIRGSFIFGMPTETPEMAEETLRFACELNADWMIFYPYHLQPGTPLAEIAAKEGMVLEEREDMHAPSYVPRAYKSQEHLAQVVRSAYRRYYLRPGYIGRALWRARKPGVLKNYIEAFKYWLSLTFSNHHKK